MRKKNLTSCLPLGIRMLCNPNPINWLLSWALPYLLLCVLCLGVCIPALAITPLPQDDNLASVPWEIKLRLLNTWSHKLVAVTSCILVALLKQLTAFFYPSITDLLRMIHVAHSNAEKHWAIEKRTWNEHYLLFFFLCLSLGIIFEVIFTLHSPSYPISYFLF